MKEGAQPPSQGFDRRSQTLSHHALALEEGRGDVGALSLLGDHLLDPVDLATEQLDARGQLVQRKRREILADLMNELLLGYFLIENRHGVFSNHEASGALGDCQRLRCGVDRARLAKGIP